MRYRKPVTVKELVIETCPNPQAIKVSFASRRAAQVACAIAKKYGEHHDGYFYEKAINEGKLPSFSVVVVSPCYDFYEVLREFEDAANKIEDGFVEQSKPTLSRDMIIHLFESKPSATLEEVLNKIMQHGYFLGQSDAAHAMQDDVAFASYCSHTSQEMTGILRSIYRKAGGDELKFTRRIINSPDPRLHRMSNMAIQIFFQFLKGK